MELFKKLNQEYDEFVSLKKPSFHLMENGSLRCVSEYDQKEFAKTYVEMRENRTGYHVIVQVDYEIYDQLNTSNKEEAIKFAYLYAHQQWTGESYDTA